MRALRTVLFLAIFVIACAAFFYFKFQEDQKERDLIEFSQSQVLFPRTPSDEIDYLSFERTKNPAIVLKREGRSWQIVSPVKTQADQMVIQGIIAALRFGKKEESFESEENQEGYGFNHPPIKLVVGTSKAPKKSTLLLGNRVPLRKLYYAKLEGNSQVFLVSENLWKSFDRSLLSLRRRLVFNFDPDDLRGVRVSFAGRTFDIVREKDHWTFAKNSPHSDEKVDPTEVRGYIELLRSVILGEFLDGGDWKDESYGLKLKQNYINVYFQKTKPQILYLGYPSREFNGTYVHMDKVFDLALIHSRLARYLERTAESFYDRRIWKESKKDLDRVMIDDGISQWVYLKKQKDWQKDEGGSLTPEKNKWLENLLAVTYELKYLSTFESNLKESPDMNAFRIKFYSSSDSDEKPLLELDLRKGKSGIEGVINRPLPGSEQGREEKYSIFKLDPKDAEFLTDVIGNLM